MFILVNTAQPNCKKSAERSDQRLSPQLATFFIHVQSCSFMFIMLYYIWLKPPLVPLIYDNFSWQGDIIILCKTEISRHAWKFSIRRHGWNERWRRCKSTYRVGDRETSNCWNGTDNRIKLPNISIDTKIITCRKRERKWVFVYFRSHFRWHEYDLPKCMGQILVKSRPT